MELLHKLRKSWPHGPHRLGRGRAGLPGHRLPLAACPAPVTLAADPSRVWRAGPLGVLSIAMSAAMWPQKDVAPRAGSRSGEVLWGLTPEGTRSQ